MNLKVYFDKHQYSHMQFLGLCLNLYGKFKSRGQPNRGYKKPNPNPNILSTIFGSYNRGRIVQKGIRFIRNRGRIVQKGIRFIRNRIDDLNRIIRLSRISGFCNRILTELFG